MVIQHRIEIMYTFTDSLLDWFKIGFNKLVPLYTIERKDTRAK
jgi:hypothetical protein